MAINGNGLLFDNAGPIKLPSQSGGVVRPDVENPMQRQIMGLPPLPPTEQQVRENLLTRLSGIAPASDRPASLEQLQGTPGFNLFAQRASEAGLDPAELVNARNQNIETFVTGGNAAQMGDFFDRSGLGDLITYGTIAAAGAGALSGLAGAGGAGGAGGSAGGASSGLTGVSVPASASTMPVAGGSGVVLPGAGSAAALPASSGLASMPSLGGAAGSAGGAAGSGLSEVSLPEGVGRISESGAGSGGFMDRVGDFFGGGGGDGSMPAWLDAIGGTEGLGSIVGGIGGLLDSANQPDETTVTQQTSLPPEVQEALNFLIDESMGLQDTGSIVPELSGVTQQGIDRLSGPLSGPGFDALSGLAGGMTNPFMGSNDLSGVTDSITAAAQRAVGDRFSQAGRSGSPGEGMTLGKTVARELAPFAFNARESDMQRQFAAGENMLDRQLQSAVPLMDMQRQRGLDTLQAGGLLDEQARRQALEPFTRLDLMSGPLVSAISGAPRSTSTTEPLFSSPLSSGLGGALMGSRIGGLFGG